MSDDIGYDPQRELQDWMNSLVNSEPPGVCNGEQISDDPPGADAAPMSQMQWNALPAEDEPWFPGGMTPREDRIADQNGE